MSSRSNDDELAQIVRDLKHPLSTIALEAELLDGKLANGDRVEAISAAHRIVRNVEFIDRLIANLLDLQNCQLQCSTCEVRSLLAHVIDRVVVSCDRDRVLLEAKYSVRAYVDDMRIQRVVANLIANALRQTSERVVVTLAPGPRTCRVSVADTRTFDHATACRDLGFEVSKKIIEAHGGKFGVEPRGDGTAFYFDLPQR